jgi:hypothetical protein
MTDLTEKYAPQLATFADRLVDVVVLLIVLALVFVLTGWLSKKLDEAERKYRVKRHIKEPSDE